MFIFEFINSTVRSSEGLMFLIFKSCFFWTRAGILIKNPFSNPSSIIWAIVL